MKATVLIDNITEDKQLRNEWGLSILIEYHGKKVLLDTGASGRFRRNTARLGIDLGQVDYGVLSHAHCDHADGLRFFLAANSRADFYLRAGSRENCYAKYAMFYKYIGIKKGTLEKAASRIRYVAEDCEIADGIWLIGHTAKGRPEMGKKVRMYVKQGRRWMPDNFSHEQSLVFDTQRGLVIFNSCSHAGAANIIREVAQAFSDKKLYAMVGGFHLYESPEGEVRALAQDIKSTGISRVYTGHCTGKKAFGILRDELGDCLQQLKTGMVLLLED